ncbi:MAG TPA: hypothetical protein VLA56_03805 [Pseudomonadales bacterium]|nr:hypothetical protein [Pseudomonadales bacterium]
MSGRRVRVPRSTATLLCAALAVGGPVLGAELLVEGRVVRVEPLTSTRQVAEQVGDCEPERPHGGDLVALLAWDLRADCRTRTTQVQVVEGYRVYYEWEDRIHDRVMDEAPGDTLTLRVRVD